MTFVEAKGVQDTESCRATSGAFDGTKQRHAATLLSEGEISDGDIARVLHAKFSLSRPSKKIPRSVQPKRLTVPFGVKRFSNGNHLLKQLDRTDGD